MEADYIDKTTPRSRMNNSEGEYYDPLPGSGYVNPIDNTSFLVENYNLTIALNDSFLEIVPSEVLQNSSALAYGNGSIDSSTIPSDNNSSLSIMISSNLSLEQNQSNILSFVPALYENSTSNGSDPFSNGSLGFVINTLSSVGENFQEAVTPLKNVSVENVSHTLNATFSHVPLEMRHPLLAVLFAFFCIMTFASNLLVIVAVIKERYLHSVTNYFIASLAMADCWIGLVVMPLGAVDEMLYNTWIFGEDWCDVWHSCDVLGTTASILNLCVISLDRYWAITDPITYPSKMTPKFAGILIALVWFAALFISFPAIFWWRAVGKKISSNACIFTEDIGYLAFSSTISFYLPLVIMVFTYYRIYRAANAQTRSLRVGSKQVHAVSNTGRDVEVTLRIHRGGGGLSDRKRCPSAPHSPAKVSCSDGNRIEQFSNSIDDVHQPLRARRQMQQKNVTISQRLARISKERTAAKTLGIVMGVFILCWLPFFLTNVIRGACGNKCIYAEHVVFPFVMWLGWTNSCMNPAIYAHRSREFRRAFISILCCSRSRTRRHYRKGMRSRIRDNDARFSKHDSTSIMHSSKL